MNVRHLARTEIQALHPYEAAVQVEDTIRLNANEAPWRSSTDHFDRPLNRYPEIRPARLRQRLAERYGCDPQNLLVTRGSSEAIDLVLRVFCVAGQDNAVAATPTFSMYEHYAVVQGAELRAVATSGDSDFAVDPNELLAACDERTKLIFLCSPNNPTGTLLPNDTLLRILDERNGKSVVVLDEAYVEFAGIQSAIDLVAEYQNLVVLRTLSKALAFAGARCGSVIADLSIIDMLNAVQAPYALATPVIECVEQALSDAALDESEQHVAVTVRERSRLRSALEKFAFVRRVWPSAANFLLVEVDDATRVMERCATDNLLLRDFGKQLPGCIRISVGSIAENDSLLQTLSGLEAGNG